ncbi:SMP-30/gluconolactonase/LRE family protein [Shewanella intestini]|uniref:SMP-30/gluconolactonase/LRE family protein n=1 Tax=Shewanella intestini TaxID=2017544 RepID=A0ABS5I5J8_9GAMM|nr:MULTISPECIES: SMP-30/gluconolactonase/LRE family protein [Shewanella]MBR9728984.1 SMP-30/gluconolactonase/LRE family protein [Shewanella intestini]MRG36950.1 gluconolactonase [Shewanella sp. XMDDZSB0408]
MNITIEYWYHGYRINNVSLVTALVLNLMLAPVSFANNKIIAVPVCDTSHSPTFNKQSLHLISDEFMFLEGPTWSSTEQSFFFSEMNINGPQAHGPEANIYRYTPHESPKLFVANSGSNGLLAHKGNLFTMNHYSRGLTKISLNDAQHSPQQLVSHYKNAKFNSPNDLIMHSNGSIYFTDPDWQLGNRKAQLPFTGVYRLTADGDLSLVSHTLIKPNGIALSVDESVLYVGDASNTIHLFSVNKQGQVGQAISTMTINSPDGMAIDCAGNLYATSHSSGKIHIFNPQSERLDTLDLKVNVTNVAFGGQDGKTLLITTAKGLYQIQTQLPGKGQFK